MQNWKTRMGTIAVTMLISLSAAALSASSASVATADAHVSAATICQYEVRQTTPRWTTATGSTYVGHFAAGSIVSAYTGQTNNRLKTTSGYWIIGSHIRSTGAVCAV
ncbi:hypothetical protein FAF44_33095 [Nonomuraea sp. MG754425]|uniref:hypothetical protein n=1 Tax=Nonomuraea sp. MG754425 TaxID=2570319 RepID=UPI001F21A7E8|nr:hypothetical protein [Nonomuraea sp. MG754425]MCF6473190.1 hypothetical protein [Nonomuraea sp. MG754425]